MVLIKAFSASLVGMLENKWDNRYVSVLSSQWLRGHDQVLVEAERRQIVL